MAINIVGIDVGSYAAKVVALDIPKGKGKRAQLLGLGMAQVPTEAILNWEDQAVPAKNAVSLAMKNLVANLKLACKYVSTSVSGDSIVVKKITIPAVSSAEMGKFIETEAEQYIPFSIKEVNLSHHVLGHNPVDNTVDLLLVAGRKTVVQNYIEAIEAAKLKPAVIDVDGLALLNAYHYTRPGNTDDVVMVDIGANMLNVVIISGGMPLIIKDEHSGGQKITDELAYRFELPNRDAEAIKVGSMQAPNPGEAAEVIDRGASSWIAAVEQSIEAAKTDNPNYNPQAILLSGGSALIPGLAMEFQKYFGIHSEIFNPLLNVSYNVKKYDQEYIKYIGPQMAVSFGLALRKVEVQ